jgi:hypothetical protein
VYELALQELFIAYSGYGGEFGVEQGMSCDIPTHGFFPVVPRSGHLLGVLAPFLSHRMEYANRCYFALHLTGVGQNYFLDSYYGAHVWLVAASIPVWVY